MGKLLLINCVDDVDRVFRYVGVDENTEVALVGYRCRGSGYKILAADPRDLPGSVANVVSLAKGFNNIKIVLFGEESFQSAVLLLAYTVLTSVEDLIGLGVSPIVSVVSGRVYEYELRPRLCIGGLRGLSILRSLGGGCVDSYEVSLSTDIPVSTVRRRLSSLVRQGLAYSVKKGRRNIYCLTEVGKAFAKL
ncbi:winged helix-turn-helix domain-containing protein [Ignisphaera sp. 4213-co]|uniref:Winged helix-turn-helix domain-containing protein n=1 Tax=Ignisphaera cupida TaxID=3050454 RepID=A0ABD4Z878_9CREN|nr:winged helix-turn-helix domain-containing protein [Ignisphaera sp. 4213-co]MDK6029405.1 winged helix-turn-helix domain-containing protein [Ignisphaera sp. 4213-co]